MRRTRYCGGLLVGVAIVGLTATLAGAQTFSSGSTGADGAFTPAANTTLTLPANGVFNFTTVNIPAGVTVKFQRNATNTPVFMLATGNVLIAGTIDIGGETGGSGGAGPVALIGKGGEGGPGGFAGGNAGRGIEFGGSFLQQGGRGLGPGGGGRISSAPDNGAGGGFGEPGVPSGGGGGVTYGSPTLLPLVGGSGGGGGAGGNPNGCAGGGGGGAILIASSGTITVNGEILARGGATGPPPCGGGGGGGGSGGGIRLVANTIAGTGSLHAQGGTGTNFGFPIQQSEGGRGRIRLEANTFTFSGFRSPPASIATPGTVFVTPNPTLSITAVAGQAAPTNPAGSFTIPDIVLPATTTSPVTVNLAASNIPVGTTIQVSVLPFNGYTATVANSTGLSGTLASSTASASLAIALNQPSVLMAETTFQLTASTGDPPVVVAGEVVKAIRVAATYGGGSTVTYITESGREVSLR